MMKIKPLSETERRVIDLRREGKTIRVIATALKISSRDVVRILKSAEGTKSQEQANKQMQEEENLRQTVYTKALVLFKEGKDVLDVTIELGVKTDEIKKTYLDFLDLKYLGEFAGVYEDIKDVLPALLTIYESMKKKGLGVQGSIYAVEFASDLMKAQERFRNIANAAISLQSGKSLL